MMRALFATPLLLIAVSLTAQTPPQPVLHGVPTPSRVRARPVRTTDMVRLVNSVEVVATTAAGVPMVEVRVVATWGGYSGQPCDCLTTLLYVGVNADGDDMHAFALPELLEPAVDSITTETQRPVLYITYGDVGARHQIRAEVVDSQLSITPVRRR